MDKRERILDAARSLFIRRGYSGSNMRHIAEAAGVSMGGLYHYFSNKEEIFRALLVGGDIRTYTARIGAMLIDPSFPDNMPEIARVIRDAIRENQDFFKLCYVDILEFQGRHIVPIIKAFRQTYMGFAAQVIQRRMDEGVLNRINPQVMLRAATDLLIHFWLEEIMLDEHLAQELGVSDDELVVEMCRVLLDGLRSRE